MKKFRNYFLCQWKRIWQVCPFIIGVTLLFTICLILLASYMQSTVEHSEKKQKIKIGLTGDVDETYLGIGLLALQRMDTLRFAIDFSTMTEDEAEKKLAAGELAAYVVFPENFVEAFDRGEDVKLLYATSNDGAGVGAVLMNELVQTVEDVVRESRDGIIGIWRLLERYPVSQSGEQLTGELFLRYVDMCLNRTKLYRVVFYGWGDRLSMKSYYFIAFLVLYLLLWGITCSPLFVKKSHALSACLLGRGLKIPLQVGAEYLAYLLLMLGNLFLMILPIEAAFQLTGIQLPEWQEAPIAGIFFFFLKLLPAVAVFAAMQFFLYELISDMISGILLQFVAGVGIAYLSGCFYPVSYFPEKMQALAGILPGGIALEYAQKCLQGIFPVGAALELLFFLILFLGLAMGARKRRCL